MGDPSVLSAEDLKRPELSIIAMKTPLKYLGDRFGKDTLNRFLEETGMDQAYLDDHNNWLSFEYAHRIMRTLVDLAGDEGVCREAGTKVLTPETLGRAAWIAMKAVGTPSLVYKGIFDHAKIYNRVGKFEVLELEKNRMVLEYRPKEGFRETDKCFCDYRIGNFVAVPTLWNLPPANCKELSCCVNGGEACTYEFTWKEKSSRVYPLGGLTVGAILTFLYSRWLSPEPDLGFWITVPLFLGVGLFGGSFFGSRKALKKNEVVNQEQQEALESSIDSISEKYVELQESNKALEEAHRELTLHKDHLEDLVHDRTRELKESKAQLEDSYEKLQELDKMKMVFFNNISHELRTPLALTLGPVEAMLQGETGLLEDRQKDYLLNIHTNSLRLLKLINNLLDLAKLEDGKMSLVYGKYSLPDHIREVMSSFQVTAQKRGIRLETEGDSQMEHVCFDREKVEKVLLNLIGNALKFTPDSGAITARWIVGEGFAKVQVMDTGPGIPEEALGRIFDRFVQVDDSLSRQYGGTGIGLSLAREIAKLHGGTIEAANRPEGGAIFAFTLPLGDKELAEDTGQEEKKDGWASALFRQADYVEDVERPGTPSSTKSDKVLKEAFDEAEEDTDDGRPLVLVVEDNEDMRGFIRDCLKKEFRVRTAVDGEDGWRKVPKIMPEMIVSDIMMPNRNGYELCAAVKSDENLKHIPFLLLSSKSETDMKVQGFEKGADDYLTKPFNPRELIVRVQNLIRLRKLEGEVLEQNRQLEKTLEDLKEAQAQLVHSEKMASLGVLSAGLVHEINNPLNASISSTRTLLRSLARIQAGEATAGEVGEKMERVATRSLHGLKRCEEIITGLLRFSRKDAHGKKDADIREGLESAVTLLTLDAGKEVTIHQEYGFKGKVFCDLGQLNQVFMNLLTNAYQSVEKKGDIWIRTEQRGEDVAVIVEDNGCGIPQEILPRIYEPFYTTKDVGKGTGLGLSISHKIILEHNGRIEVESTPGKGSTFMVLLPLESQKRSEPEEIQNGSVRKAIGL